MLSGWRTQVESSLLIVKMFPIQNCKSIGMRVQLAIIAFGITEFPAFGSRIPVNGSCENVHSEVICFFEGSNETMDWYNAMHLCSSFNATLPVIRNKNDQDAVADYLKSHATNFQAWSAGSSIVWSSFIWINRQSSEDFVQVEFRRFGGQDYGALDNNFKFTAHAASEELPYICQYQSTYSNCSSDNVTIVTDINLRLISDSRSWYDARNQCLMTNGDLAIIGDAELGFLKSLKLNESYWIGLRQKSWRWTPNDYGDISDEIKYTDWDSNAFVTDGDCIAIGASDGKWKSFGCFELKKVMCQSGSCVTSAASTSDTSAETINTFLLIYAVIVSICLAGISIVIVTFIVRKHVCHRCARIASNSDTAENKTYQDLETTQRQANPDGTYAELQLQPLYEEVGQRGK